MDFKQLLIMGLRRPAELPDVLRPIKLKLSFVLEGAVFIAATTSLLNSLLEKLIFKSSANASKLLENNSLSFIFNPISMFAFELIFIITVMASILFFSNFSNKKVAIEELGKNVLFLFLVTFVFKFIQVLFLFVSFDLYYIFRFFELVWFIWALSSVVSILYTFKSVLLTAFLGAITVSLTMGFLFMIFISIIQFFLVGNLPNV